MPTQLNYSFITQPNPGYLIAGHTAELEFTVSNSGAAITLSSLAFAFPYGSAGSDLCASVSDVAATTLPGPGWTAGPDESGNFVLTPPEGSISIGLDGLTFTISIQINAQVGVVNLNPGSGPVQSFTIKESTAAGHGYWSPPAPLSKFPLEFQFSNLVANPPIVQQGGPIEISWTGTPGASYTVDWPGDEAAYSGGPAPITQSDTSFPPRGSGQTLAAGASQSAFFSVTAEYSSGGQKLHAGPLTVSVGVNPNAPTITSFTAIWQGPVLELNWATENATSVEIPAITSDTQNQNGNFPFTPSSTKPLPSSITLTASNQASQTASRTLVESYQQAAGSPAPVGRNPTCVAVSPDSARVFVTNLDDTLTVLDIQTLQPITGSPVSVGNNPTSVAVSPDGTRVYVANFVDNTLTVLDAGTLQPISGSPVPVGDQPHSVAVSPDGARVFVTNFGGTTLTVLDAGTLQPITGSPVWAGVNPWSVAVSPDGTRVFVANYVDNTLTVLDAQTLQPVAGSPVSVGNFPWSVAVSPDSTRVFVANYFDSTLTVLDAQTLQPISGSPVSVGNSPVSVAVSPDGKRVFVANRSDNTLTVLDAGTLQPITGSPAVGNGPSSVAVSPDGTRVFVANQNDNTLTALTPAFVPANG